MLVKVKRVFYDENGLHRVGETVEVKEIDKDLMDEVTEKKAEKKISK